MLLNLLKWNDQNSAILGSKGNLLSTNISEFILLKGHGGCGWGFGKNGYKIGDIGRTVFD